MTDSLRRFFRRRFRVTISVLAMLLLGCKVIALAWFYYRDLCELVYVCVFGVLSHWFLLMRRLLPLDKRQVYLGSSGLSNRGRISRVVLVLMESVYRRASMLGQPEAYWMIRPLTPWFCGLLQMELTVYDHHF